MVPWALRIPLRNILTALVDEGAKRDNFDVTVPVRLLQNAQAYTNFASRYALRGGGGDAEQAANELAYLHAELDTLKQIPAGDTWLKRRSLLSMLRSVPRQVAQEPPGDHEKTDRQQSRP